MGWSTTSWIFLAVAYASGEEAAALDEVIGAADGLNKAIPSHWELQRSLGRLQHLGWVEKDGDGRYRLTEKGASLKRDADAKRSHMFGVLDELTLSLPDGGEIHRDEEITPEAVETAYQKYKKRFWKLYRELESDQ